MNYSKLAQLVQELEQNGFEEEATNLADAMETEASPDVIFPMLILFQKWTTL